MVGRIRAGENCELRLGVTNVGTGPAVVRTGNVPERGASQYSQYRLADANPARPLSPEPNTIDQWWKRATWFQERIVPVAEEFRIRLGVHPQDPGVTLLQTSLRADGLFYVSYNAMPGMAALEPLRELMRLSGHEADSALERAGRGTALLRAMNEVGAAFLDDPRVAERVTSLLAEDPAYIAHEYWNAHWTSFYHREVAEMLREAGLLFACSTRPASEMEEVRFSRTQRALLDRAACPGERETFKDFFTNQTFRTDLFVGKAAQATRSDLERQVVRSRFVCVVPEHEIPAGAPDSYRTVVEATLASPTDHEYLSRDPHRMRGRLDVIVHHLLAMEVIGLALPGAGECRKESIRRFNDVVLRRALAAEYLPGLVSPFTGSVVPLAPGVLSQVAGILGGQASTCALDRATSALLIRSGLLS